MDLFDLRALHPFDDQRALEQVAAELREEDPATDRADLMSAPADALHALGHRRGCLDLDHEVDRPHVDPELEGAGRDDARQPPGLEVLFGHQPLLAAD